MAHTFSSLLLELESSNKLPLDNLRSVGESELQNFIKEIDLLFHKQRCAWEERYFSLQSKYEASEKELKMAREEVSAYQTQISRLTNELDAKYLEKRTACEKYELQLEKMKAQVQAIREKYQHVVRKYHRHFSKEKNSHSAQDSEASNAALKSQLNDVIKENVLLHERCSFLEGSLKSLQSNANHSKVSQGFHSEKFSNQRDKATEMDVDAVSLPGVADDCETVYRGLPVTLNNLRHRSTSPFPSDSGPLSAHRDDLQDMTSNHLISLDKIDGVLVNSEQQLEDLQCKLQKSSAARDLISDSNRVMRDGLGRTETLAQDFRRELQDVRSQLQEQTKLVEVWREFSTSKQGDLESLQATVNRQKDIIKVMEDALRGVQEGRKEIDTLRLALREGTSRAQQMERERNDLELKLRNAQRVRNSLTKRVTALSEECNIMRRLTEFLSSSLQDLSPISSVDSGSLCVQQAKVFASLQQEIRDLQLNNRTKEDSVAAEHRPNESLKDRVKGLEREIGRPVTLNINESNISSFPGTCQGNVGVRATEDSKITSHPSDENDVSLFSLSSLEFDSSSDEFFRAETARRAELKQKIDAHMQAFREQSDRIVAQSSDSRGLP